MTPPFALEVLHLEFVLQAKTLMRFGPQIGGQIRGALWRVLQSFACTDPHANPKQFAEHSQHCPMCQLLALELQQADRGINPARPLAVRPPRAVHPLQDRYYEAGDCFTVGVNLFGAATQRVVYLVQAFQKMGQIGVGYGRGQFAIQQIRAVDPFNDAADDLLTGGRLTPPTRTITAQTIAAALKNQDTDHIRLRFLTPTTLVQDGTPVAKPEFSVLIARLLERCQALNTYYTADPIQPEPWRDLYLSLTEQAQHIERRIDTTQWVRVEGGSRRQNKMTSMSGLVGDVSYHGDLTPFLPWLLWGQSLHVGKHVVKGNGWYQIL